MNLILCLVILTLHVDPKLWHGQHPVWEEIRDSRGLRSYVFFGWYDDSSDRFDAMMAQYNVLYEQFKAADRRYWDAGPDNFKEMDRQQAIMDDLNRRMDALLWSYR